jgi:hypothetical protein
MCSVTQCLTQYCLPYSDMQAIGRLLYELFEGQSFPSIGEKALIFSERTPEMIQWIIGHCLVEKIENVDETMGIFEYLSTTERPINNEIGDTYSAASKRLYELTVFIKKRKDSEGILEVSQPRNEMEFLHVSLPNHIIKLLRRYQFTYSPALFPKPGVCKLFDPVAKCVYGEKYTYDMGEELQGHVLDFALNNPDAGAFLRKEYPSLDVYIDKITDVRKLSPLPGGLHELQLLVMFLNHEKETRPNMIFNSSMNMIIVVRGCIPPKFYMYTMFDSIVNETTRLDILEAPTAIYLYLHEQPDGDNSYVPLLREKYVEKKVLK